MQAAILLEQCLAYKVHEINIYLSNAQMEIPLGGGREGRKGVANVSVEDKKEKNFYLLSLLFVGQSYIIKS